MVNWNDVLSDYYINKLTTTKMLDAYPFLPSERMYDKFPKYTHDDISCEYCGGKMESYCLSKSSSLCHEEIFDNLSSFDVEEYKTLSVQYSLDRHNLALSTGKAIKTKEKYIVSIPCCVKCGHKPFKKCNCSSCDEIKKINESIALEMLMKQCEARFEGRRAIDSVSCKELFYLIQVLTLCDKDGLIELKGVSGEAKKFISESGFFHACSVSVAESLHMVSICEYVVDREKVKFHFKAEGCEDIEAALNTLKRLVYKNSSQLDFKLDVLDLWSGLAMQESQSVLAYYTGAYGFRYEPTEQILSAIKRSLSRFGLAMTARYIYDSSKYADHKGKEQGLNRRHAFNMIGSSINYWIDHVETRQWEPRPFRRGNEVLIEPRPVIVFSHVFLEIYGIDYLSDPISINTLNEKIRA